MRSRSWCFTLNNYVDADVERLTSVKCKYIVFGKEIGEKGTPHLQGYVNFSSAKTMGVAKMLLSMRCHLEKAKGNAEQNRKYCVKDGDFVEVGTLPRAGRRVDLEKVAGEIAAGKKVDDICLDNPIMYHKYGRTLNKLEDLRMRKVFRTEMTKAIWYWGGTGVGKSHFAFEGFTPETHYVWPNDKGWWDGYCQQDVVVLNDYRGELPYNTLLQLVDKWPYSVSRRNREPMPFISKLIIITSSLPPSQVYNRRLEEDSLEQLLRRVHVVEVNPCKSTEVVEGNTDLDLCARSDLLDNINGDVDWDVL